MCDMQAGGASVLAKRKLLFDGEVQCFIFIQAGDPPRCTAADCFDICKKRRTAGAENRGRQPEPSAPRTMPTDPLFQELTKLCKKSPADHLQNNADLQKALVQRKWCCLGFAGRSSRTTRVCP